MTLDDHGSLYLPGAATALLPALVRLAEEQPSAPGSRLRSSPALAAITDPAGPVHAAVAAHLGPDARPVRAVLFNKTPGRNWALGWHQDRTVVVRVRREVAGYGPWTTKSGLLHVEPPFAVIESMVTVRIHLDPVPVDNAPLLVAPGSHRLGRIAEPDIAAAVARCGTATCLAEAGDLWLYATAILHASGASAGHAHRRVLQLDYSACPLNGGLEWVGV